MKQPKLGAELAQRLEGEVSGDPEVLDHYSRDTSLFEIRPALVAYPKNASDVGKVVSFATEYEVPLAVRGGGTDMTGGPLTGGGGVDVQRDLNRFIGIKDQKDAKGAGGCFP